VIKGSPAADNEAGCHEKIFQDALMILGDMDPSRLLMDEVQGFHV
jgi:hypothetical protein